MHTIERTVGKFAYAVLFVCAGFEDHFICGCSQLKYALEIVSWLNGGQPPSDKARIDANLV